MPSRHPRKTTVFLATVHGTTPFRDRSTLHRPCTLAHNMTAMVSCQRNSNDASPVVGEPTAARCTTQQVRWSAVFRTTAFQGGRVAAFQGGRVALASDVASPGGATIVVPRFGRLASPLYACLRRWRSFSRDEKRCVHHRPVFLRPMCFRSPIGSENLIIRVVDGFSKKSVTRGREKGGQPFPTTSTTGSGRS